MVTRNGPRSCWPSQRSCSPPSSARRKTDPDHALLEGEQALGAALLALSAGEASLLEVLHGLHFLNHQHRTRLELRVHRELLLMELARQVGCRVEQLPWEKAPVSG